MNSLLRVSARNHAGLILMTQIASYTVHRTPYKYAVRSTRYVSLSQVAKEMGLSQGFLEEIAMALKKAGLIRGRKGPGGGYQLAKPAKQITAEQILTALEGPLALVKCCKGKCAMAGKCSSKSLWNFLQQDVTASLKRTTLAQLVK